MHKEKPNHRKQMDDIIQTLQDAGERKRLLLHACCAPCSTYCLETLVPFFDVTVLFYNPNLTEKEEYERRLAEEKRLIAWFNGQMDTEMLTGTGHDVADGMIPFGKPSEIKIIETRYAPAEFFAIAKGLEDAPEGGERCRRCFTLRLNETAAQAKANGFDFFTTTLTISPLKNADLLNEIGQQAGAEYGVAFLPSDFKKKNGYLRSIELSKECGLYRQDYCGCIFSKQN